MPQLSNVHQLGHIKSPDTESRDSARIRMRSLFKRHRARQTVRIFLSNLTNFIGVPVIPPKCDIDDLPGISRRRILDDAQAIYSDWAAVGNDLRVAMGQVGAASVPELDEPLEQGQAANERAASSDRS